MMVKINNRYTKLSAQRGAMTIMYVMLTPVLIVSMGIALDLGKNFIVKSELQNAADACALAAAYELDGAASQFTRAQAAGLNLGAANSAYFQKNAVSNATVQFSTTATGGFSAAGAAPAAASFARCDVNQPNVSNWFIQMVGIGNQTIQANAVATSVPGQNTCALPIGICSSELVGKSSGDWIEGVQSAQGGSGGFFRWIDFSPPAGGASELNGLLSGDNTCSINSNAAVPIGQFGVIASANVHYNSRFGIRSGGVSNTAIPDLSGYAYFTSNWPSKRNAYADFATNRRPVNAPYQAPAGISINGNPTILNAAQLAAQGDASRRVQVAPVINCTTQTFQSWACIFLLHPMSTSGPPTTRMYIEYLGSANGSGPCKSFALAGDGTGTGPRVISLVQ